MRGYEDVVARRGGLCAALVMLAWIAGSPTAAQTPVPKPAAAAAAPATATPVPAPTAPAAATLVPAAPAAAAAAPIAAPATATPGPAAAVPVAATPEPVAPAAAAPAATAPAATVPAQSDAPSPAATGPATLPAAAPATPAPPLKSDIAVKIPARPDDPRAAKTYGLLETHCARCHQAGKTETPLTSGSISNILAVDDLARNPLLIRPGLPDASKLYEVLVTRHAPLDIYGAPGAAGAVPQLGAGPQPGEPETEDLEAVRTWIRDLPLSKSACQDRKPVSAADADQLALEAIKGDKVDASDLRFISLAHLYNLCAKPEDMAAYRQAIVKLLNSLSWSSDPIAVTALGPAGAVLSFKLSDLGWVSGHWDILQRIYPKGLQNAVPDALKTATRTDIPVLRADWFADAASKPPLYYALLGVPAMLSDLAKLNGLDIDQNIKSARARRLAVRTSAVVRGNRLVERHEGGRGALWLVYDFATSQGEQDLFERPLGPKAGGNVRNPFKPDAIRAMFTLPNGFLGYALFDAAGNRIDRVLPGLEKPLMGGETNAVLNVTRAGANCLACHVHGLKPVRDDLRPFMQTDKFTPAKDVKDAVLALYAIDSETLAFSDGDGERYRNAQKAAGLDPDFLIGGIEPVNALARQYLANADVTLAAAQQGLDLKAFQKVLADAPGPAATLARRLQHGVLTRPELDRLLALLPGPDETAAHGKGPAREAEKPPVKEDSGAVRLSLWVDKARPVPGDLIALHAEADNDCFLTLISIDPAGKATVLFPNDFETDNLITAGKTVRVPGAEAPYQLRVKEAGSETLLAQCSTSPVPPSGIEHDFERQRFTVLGNWENFVHDMLVIEADIRRNPEKAERARAAARAGAIQRRQERGEQTEKRLDTAPGRNLRDGRAVIVIGNG